MQAPPVLLPDLPHTSKLTADLIHNPDSLSAFYTHPRRDLASFREAAACVRLQPERRAALVELLRAQNPGSQMVERLRDRDTVAVLTGQQVGLFSGPSYTVYKALHTARLAAWLTENGVPAVPVFWMATEDHDLAEVARAWVFDSEHHPRAIEFPAAANTGPVGDFTLAAPPVEALRDALSSLPFGEEVAALAAEAYHPGATLGEAFGRLLDRILSGFDIPRLDPMHPGFRALAAPALAKAVAAGPDLTAAVLARNQQLAAAGYHAQVHVERDSAFLFWLENGRRSALRRSGRDFLIGGRRIGFDELLARPTALSPNALLRPVIQDSVLPTVAYVGGPAEVAYLAQSQPLYQALDVPMPVAVPRAGFTLLGERDARLLERYRMAAADFFDGPEAAAQQIAARLVPTGLHNSVQDTGLTINSAIETLAAELLRFDPTLEKALRKSARKISHQLSRMASKTDREALRRSERATGDAASLSGLLFPEQHIQERLYSILPFLAKHGLDLPHRIAEAIDPESAGHKVMVV